MIQMCKPPSFAVFLFTMIAFAGLGSMAQSQALMPENVKEILTRRCFECHGRANLGGVGSMANMDNLLARKFILPGKPVASKLIQVVKSGQMPYQQEHLSEAEINSLRDWIASLPETVVTGTTSALPEVYPVDKLPVSPPTTSVLQHHANPSRDGLYVDSKFTRQGALGLHLTKTLGVAIDGQAYAQPLFIEHAIGKRDLLIVATETNFVYAVDPRTDEIVWKTQLGKAVASEFMPCGNIDPLGVTGTPIVDRASATLFIDAMLTPDHGKTKSHRVFRLALVDGSIQKNWPVDVAEALEKIGRKFHAEFQNQRGALALVNGTLFVPYGGHFGDCGDYRGWIVGIPINDPGHIRAWSTMAHEGGIWAPGGISSSGNFVFAATGNTEGTETWSGGEALIKLPAATLEFQKAPEYFFSPSNWRELDDGDVDVGGVCPVLVDLPTGTPNHLAVGLGKDGNAYVINRDRPGGIGGALITAPVASMIITAPAAYSTTSGTYVAFRASGSSCPGGASGDLTAIRITPKPALKLTTAWCATQNGSGSPIVTTTDGHSNAIVWSIGAEGDDGVHAFDAETGQPLFADDQLPRAPGVSRFVSPIVAKGKMYIVGGGKVYVFTPDPNRTPSSVKKSKSKKKSGKKSSGKS